MPETHDQKFPPFERAFTLIELLVVIAIIAIMMAVAVSSLQWHSERAKATKDMSNLRQIGLATQMYLNDNNGVVPWPSNRIWMSQLELNPKYLSSWRVLESPFDKRSTSELGTQQRCQLGINANMYVRAVPQFPLTRSPSL